MGHQLKIAQAPETEGKPWKPEVIMPKLSSLNAKFRDQRQAKARFKALQKQGRGSK